MIFWSLPDVKGYQLYLLFYMSCKSISSDHVTYLGSVGFYFFLYFPSTLKYFYLVHQRSELALCSVAQLAMEQLVRLDNYSEGDQKRTKKLGSCL